MGLLNKKENNKMKNKTKDIVKQHNSDLSMFNSSHFPDLFAMMNNFMDKAWNDLDLTSDAFYALQPKANLPKINLIETDSNYEVEIATSGVNKDDLELEFKDSCLFIKADKAEEKDFKDDGKKWLIHEISSRSFRRAIKFPVKIDSSSITSTYNTSKGVVVCTLPKVKKEEPEVVRINIE